MTEVLIKKRDSMSQEINFIEFIVLNKDLVDGRIVRAKKDTRYQITFEDDYAIYFIAENELTCGLSKNNSTHQYTKIKTQEK